MEDSAVSHAKVYEAVQKAISETDDISFKLIGFVPLVSGTAVLSILFTEKAVPVLPLLSLFAAATTLGLFWWELRNIQTCRWYLQLAAELEARALADLKLANDVMARPKAPGGVGKHGAARIIYTVTILTWLALPLGTAAFWTLHWAHRIAYGLIVAAILAETIRAVCASTSPSHVTKRSAKSHGGPATRAAAH